VLAGGGIRGGMVFGKSDRHAAYPTADAVAPADLIATAYHLLGVPEHQAFPDLAGRPMTVSTGKIMTDWLL